MRFKVPQFIDIEDKIFGPLTFKQFVYLAGGGGLVYLIFTLLPFFVAAIIGLPVAGFALALAFYKVNGKPFINTVEAFFKFHIRSKLYLWHKGESKKQEVIVQAAAIDTQKRSVLTESKLKTLSWSLDVIDTSKKLEK